MPEIELTTIQVDVETRDKLRQIAECNERSMAAHLRWIVRHEWERLFDETKKTPGKGDDSRADAR